MRTQRTNDIVLRANQLLIAASVLFLVITVAIIITNVISRYVVNVSLPWSAELSRYSMIWSALLAAAVLVNRQEHLSVDVLAGLLGGRWRVASQLVVCVGSMTFFLILVLSGSMLVLRTSGQVASSIEALPMNVVYSIFPLAGLLMFFGSMVVLLRILSDEEPAD